MRSLLLLPVLAGCLPVGEVAHPLARAVRAPVDERVTKADAFLGELDDGMRTRRVIRGSIAGASAATCIGLGSLALARPEELGLDRDGSHRVAAGSFVAGAIAVITMIQAAAVRTDEEELLVTFRERVKSGDPEGALTYARDELRLEANASHGNRSIARVLAYLAIGAGLGGFIAWRENDRPEWAYLGGIGVLSGGAFLLDSLGPSRTERASAQWTGMGLTARF